MWEPFGGPWPDGCAIHTADENEYVKLKNIYEVSKRTWFVNEVFIVPRRYETAGAHQSFPKLLTQKARYLVQTATRRKPKTTTR